VERVGGDASPASERERGQERGEKDLLQEVVVRGERGLGFDEEGEGDGGEQGRGGREESELAV